jgi:hypothetical protein
VGLKTDWHELSGEFAPTRPFGEPRRNAAATRLFSLREDAAQ